MSKEKSPEAIDLVEMTVDEVQAGFASGAFTSEALTEACLDRIARYNPRYNAVIFLNPDALKMPATIDRRRTTGEARARWPACRSWSRIRWTWWASRPPPAGGALQQDAVELI